MLTLETILAFWKDLNSSLEFEDICFKTCKTAVKALAVDHSTFVRFEKPPKYGEVVAEFSREALPLGVQARGMRIPLEGIPEERPLLAQFEPIHVPNVEDLEPGPFKDNLCSWG